MQYFCAIWWQTHQQLGMQVDKLDRICVGILIMMFKRKIHRNKIWNFQNLYNFEQRTSPILWLKSKFAYLTAYDFTICVYNPILVKEKCVWEPYICLHFCQLFVYFQNEYTPPKHILELYTWGQICLLVIWKSAYFDLCHLVLLQLTSVQNKSTTQKK